MPFRACSSYCHKALLRQKSLLVLLLALTTAYLFASPMRDVCASFGMKASILPYFVFLGDNYIANGILLTLWVWLIEGVPYRDASEDLVKIRCDHTSHVLGIFLHIAAMSALYWAAMLLISVLVMLPHVELDLGWGRFYMSLNRGAGDRLVAMNFIFSKKLQQLMTPAKALLLSWSLHFLASVFLGLTVCLINSRARHAGGGFIALMIIVFDSCFQGLGMPYVVYYFSPVSWVNLNMLDMSLTLKVEGVSKQFGKQEVLANVNLEMRSGQIYGLVGRNGSGKTVLMKLLCGLLPPSSGAIWVSGKPVISGKKLPCVYGVHFDTAGFIPNLSGKRNLRLLSRLRGVATDRDVELAIENVGLDPRSRKKVNDVPARREQLLKHCLQLYDRDGQHRGEKADSRKRPAQVAPQRMKKGFHAATAPLPCARQSVRDRSKSAPPHTLRPPSIRSTADPA